MTGKTKDKTEENTVSGKYGGSHTPLTYNNYLKVEELKQLQVCQSEPNHHDEPLFIIIHQTYELWFKLILHELDSVVALMKEGNVRKSSFYMKRVVEIMKLLVGQIHILETMSPRDFLGFRNNLNPASGFQSSQFREVEFIAGLRSEHMLNHFKQDTVAYEKLVERFNSDSLGELFYRLLEDKGLKLPREKEEYTDEKKEELKLIRITELRKLYEENDKYYDLHALAELMMDLDELISLWRTHHVTVVERIIGFKRGTGGSEGVGYLRTTLTKRCFPDLWQLRTYLEA